jgi:adenosylcobinamide-phosphate synthase
VEREVAHALIASLAAHPLALLVAVLIDLALGDPTYAWHPVRLMGRMLTGIESVLRRCGLDGYGGGILLFIVLAGVWVGGISWGILVVSARSVSLGWWLHLFVLYSLLALGDLLRHVWNVERALARNDLAGARIAISHLVGRDTAPMDAAACRRAAVESLSENLTDGFTSPLFWYALTGLPGLVLFKIVSTMDSMVGYKTPRYLQFGWCGARLDDAMNYLPARLTWGLIAIVAAMLPGCSAGKALRVGWRQHGILLGPNSGWSEAATAGGIQRRIVGPIWLRGQLVTEIWIGEADDPPLASRSDLIRGMLLVTATGLLAVAVVLAALLV